MSHQGDLTLLHVGGVSVFQDNSVVLHCGACTIMHLSSSMMLFGALQCIMMERYDQKLICTVTPSILAVDNTHIF